LCFPLTIAQDDPFNPPAATETPRQPLRSELKVCRFFPLADPSDVHEANSALAAEPAEETTQRRVAKRTKAASRAEAPLVRENAEAGPSRIRTGGE
jgi:hypothetical protein